MARRKKSKIKDADYFLDTAEQYARAVCRQTTRHGKFMRAVCADYITAVNGGMDGYSLSDVHATAICRFAEQFPHVKGSQFHGNIKLQPWQIFQFVNIFGWVDEMKRRRHSTAFTMVSKKNGKSTMAALIALYMLSPLEGERGAEVICGASKRDQAKIVLNIARDMLTATPVMMEMMNMSVWAHNIECLHGGIISKLRAIASDSPDTDDGISPSGIILDELHAHINGKLRSTLVKGTAARQNSLLYQITTAGEYSDQSPAVQQLDFARQWLLDEVDAPWFFPMVFEQDDPAMEIKRPKTWFKSNPNLDVTFPLSKLKENYEDSKMSPEMTNEFIQKHLNGFTAATQSWLDMEKWRLAQADKTDRPKKLKLFVGVDLANRLDLTAIGMVWVDDSGADPHYWIAAKSFTTKYGMEQNAAIKLYANAGLIEVIGESSMDQSVVEEYIVAIQNQAVRSGDELIDIGFDPKNADVLAERLERRLAAELVEVPQGARTFSGPMKEFVAAMHGGRLHIITDKCLNWQAGNAILKTDTNGDWRPDKSAKRHKVDAIIAILIGFCRAYRFAQPAKPKLTAEQFAPGIFPETSEQGVAT